MTDISARLRGEKGHWLSEVDIKLEAADHIDTQDAKIKALVEALNDYISDTAYGGNVEADTAETARTALAAAKEPT